MIHTVEYMDGRGDLHPYQWESDYKYTCERCGNSLLEDVDIAGYLSDTGMWESIDDYVQSEVGDLCSWCNHMSEKLLRE